MLPDGSELFRVIVPRYDDRRQLVGVMKAGTIRLVDSENAEAEHCSIEFDFKNNRPHGRIELENLRYHQPTGMIRAEEAIHLRSDRLHADGSGLQYDIHEGEGFLRGPARTWIPAAQPTVMTPPRPRISRTASLFGAATVFTIATANSEPEAGKSRAVETFTAGAVASREELASALADSNAANEKVAAFLEKTDGIDLSEVPGKAPAAKPLEIEPRPEDLVIRCDGGMYFNPDEGVFVYLGNVRVKDPRFELTGANELKIFLEKTDEGGKSTGRNQDLEFGEISRVTATGSLVFAQAPGGGREPIRASGASFSYRIQTDQVVLSGGYPWVVQGGIALRAKEPDLSLRIQPKARKFQTEGPWDTIVPLKELEKKDR